jgi:hypothetical protein
MARLFITERELDLISDLTKEVIKDVIGQKIYYYRVREELTKVHDIYEEAIEKVFDPPIELESLVEWVSPEISTNQFGSETKNTISVMIHQRDILDKNIVIREGDYFSYGTTFYELTSLIPISKIFGQVEHLTGYKATGKQAREGQIGKSPLGPLGDQYTDKGAVQNTFEQQRGYVANDSGKTNDVRALQEKQILEKPISLPRKVEEDNVGSSSFYGDE